MMELIIRNVDINDSFAISSLSGQLGYESEVMSIEKRISGILKNPDHCIFVAEQNGIIIGWIHGLYSIRVESDAFIEIGGLIVDENKRRRGVGKQLVETVSLWAKSFNCSNIRVRCNIKRVESHKFYESIGFSLNKEQKVFDKN